MSIETNWSFRKAENAVYFSLATAQKATNQPNEEFISDQEQRVSSRDTT